MIRVLLYGGCHALVLRDFLETLFDPEEIETTLLINFELIASGRQFPYETLNQYDAVVFSPIENKGDYNTDRLVEHCQTAGTRAICFPWMEWHAYCPGAIKGHFKGRFQWFYPELIEIASRFDRFDAFVDHVAETFPRDELISFTFARTTSMVSSAEKRHDAAVGIIDYILANYRSSRLFLISDHPSRALYVHVLRQIMDLLGVPLTEMALARLPSEEPQWRWRTPIFPKVANRLGLAFKDSDWIDDELLPARSWPLETYLRLYFYKESVILGPVGDARVHLDTRDRPIDVPIDIGTRIFANPLPGPISEDLETYAYLDTLAGKDVAISQHASFKIDSRQWRSTWQF